MAELVGEDEVEALRIELAEVGRSLRSSFRYRAASFRSVAPSVKDDSSNAHNVDDDDDDENAKEKWAEIERLPTFDRLRTSLFDDVLEGKKVVDVAKLGAVERRMFIHRLIKHIEHDNLRLLQKLKHRIDLVGVKLPTVEVRYKNVKVEAVCEVVSGKPLPTLWNTVRATVSDFVQIFGSKSRKAKVGIIKDVSGVIKPGRLTLLLGPRGCGKSSLLLALSGNLRDSLEVTGEITYNGYKLQDFVPQKTSAYISQKDLHIPEMTVKETLDFSSRFQGVGTRGDIIKEVSRREKLSGIIPDPDIDAYMKAISIEGLKESLQTDYILKILGLETCSDTMVGNAMRRGISGGQKKRLTTGEMIVGPTKALFMDEISNGLDSSTTFQIVSYLRQLVHITDATILVSLLQPAPETFDLFDDIILMAEGKIVYHGPRKHVLEFFEDCGFRCPQRKGVADFLQEVISKKDQAKYWIHTEQCYTFVSVDTFSAKFKKSAFGKKLDEELMEEFVDSEIHKTALSFSVYSLPKWTLFKACMSREILLMRRNSFVYVFKTTQLIIIAFMTMTVFLRTEMKVDALHANYYMGALFYSLIILLVDAFPELSMTVARLPIFFKQRDFCFYPAWAYAIPAAILKVPLSLVESLAWTCLTYYVIGYSPEVGRFFRQFILLFAIHLASMSMFRFVASVFQTIVASSMAGSLTILVSLLFAGFIIPQSSMPVWLKWGFWVSPISYGEIGLSVNEFLAPRWQKVTSTNVTIGNATLHSRALDFEDNIFWISVGALFGFAIAFNIGYTLALTFLKSPGKSRAIISQEKLAELQHSGTPSNGADVDYKSEKSHVQSNVDAEKAMDILPFLPLPMAFQDVQYYVDIPAGKRGQQRKRQLLCDITGTFRPGVLTALMGVSGAGKTTLMDVLSGRKTSGTIKGSLKIGGYDKVQETFARISGYCEQTDIHSPHITVEESVIFSAWLRLSPQVDYKTKDEFVNEVLKIIELEGIRDTIVGIPGINGLSTEQRKRLTIAVELVANPSIIFMDEPTSGLDARAAAIVMRAVKNVADTGRTIVCTIHQPSIDIFEAFDELILLKAGGRIIYSGSLGQHSGDVIKYFENVPGVAKIKDNYNPATWMLEVTSTSVESELGIDFAQIYVDSDLYQFNKDLVCKLSNPPPATEELQFATRYSQSCWGQFKSCLWKQHLSYWRSPSYNLTRLLHTVISSLIYGVLFWQHGKKIKNQQDIFNIVGAFSSAVTFMGISNCSSVLPYVERERTVMYRERFSGMYSSWPYSIAQVLIEVPYIFIEALVYVSITYPMIGFYWSAYKVFWYLYAMFCALLYYNYMGMLLVSMTPNFMIAGILSSAFYTTLNLFSGYYIPRLQIPMWWRWFQNLVPTYWTLHGLVSSQYGDIDNEITAFGKTKMLSAFLKDYFGYQHDRLPVVAVVILAFPLAFATLFAIFIGRLNFQKR